MSNLNQLKEEIDEYSKDVFIDNLSISINEFLSLYEENSWIISPEFQRMFRWDIDQKSRFIESILLGFPIPPIYVAVDSEGKYLTIDGLQRLSTILEFTNNLDVETLEMVPNFNRINNVGLTSQEFLTSLNSYSWGELDNRETRHFKNKRLDLIIIESRSSDDLKFQVFNRLNGGQSRLSEQEVRNCLVLMLNGNHFTKFKDLSQSALAQKLIFNSISEKKQLEAYHENMLFRMLVVMVVDKTKWEQAALRHSNLEPLLDSFTKEIFTDVRLPQMIETITLTLSLIDKADSEFQFKKKRSPSSYTGEFSNSLFEYIGISLAKYIFDKTFSLSNMADHEAPIIAKILELHSNAYTTEEFTQLTQYGARPVSRFYNVVELGYNEYS